MNAEHAVAFYEVKRDYCFPGMSIHFFPQGSSSSRSAFSFSMMVCWGVLHTNQLLATTPGTPIRGCCNPANLLHSSPAA